MIGRGGARPVGVEIELERVDSAGVATAVHRRFGGTIQIDDPHRMSVRGTEFGNFRIERDEAGNGTGKSTGFLADIGSAPARTEAATPPMPANRLSEIDVLVHDLGRLGAQGSQAGLLNGIGLHLNPSLAPADLTPGAILRVMQAYLMQAPVLLGSGDSDPTGSQLPIVDPFPVHYVDHVLDPAYAPGFETLIADYLLFNPTRNRPLDMLPLFSLIDRPRVSRAVPDPRISARPSFRWRLPNAEFEIPPRSVAGRWTQWLRIETASLDTDDLAARLAHRTRPTAAEQQRLAVRN
ncbi:amidoligase family protein [Thalassobaculum sp.]|uniref:amidoligase family protein n=1 Tax=Thalassobaculum sp. TaxID=2022740 RepID=UPI0032EF307E